VNSDALEGTIIDIYFRAQTTNVCS